MKELIEINNKNKISEILNISNNNEIDDKKYDYKKHLFFNMENKFFNNNKRKIYSNY